MVSKYNRAGCTCESKWRCVFIAFFADGSSEKFSLAAKRIPRSIRKGSSLMLSTGSLFVNRINLLSKSVRPPTKSNMIASLG